MMGTNQGQKALFSYGIDLDQRVRLDHPLRRVAGAVDFSFVQLETERFYGKNGNVSVDPAIVMKLMFLLFFDDIKSERELMRMLAERLDYLWFLGFSLDDEIPNHSILSKARARWGREIFERLFIRTVEQCVRAGLVDGSKLHMDGSLIDADASRDSVVRSSPELIAALKRAYGAVEQKLEGNLADPNYVPVNASLCSTTDPDAPCVRQNKKGAQGDSRPRYKHHRAIDDRCGVITAVVTTPGDTPEPTQTIALVDQHQKHTGLKVRAVVADQQYGTAENYRQLSKIGVAAHIAPFNARKEKEDGLFTREKFKYDEKENVYICPKGKKLHRHNYNERRQITEYHTRKGVCTGCPLRDQCTTSKTGRKITRHDNHDEIMRAHLLGKSSLSKQDRRRRRYLMEGSFAQAANLHHFTRTLASDVAPRNPKLARRGRTKHPNLPRGYSTKVRCRLQRCYFRAEQCPCVGSYRHFYPISDFLPFGAPDRLFEPALRATRP